MGSLSNFLENKVLDHLFKTTAYVPPATVYLGLSTADPGESGSGWAEPAYTGYARKPITFGAAASRGVIQSGLITFDLCTSGSATVTHWGLFDSLASGNLLAYGSLSPAKHIVGGNTPKVAAGQITVSFLPGAVFTSFANAVLDWLFRGQALAQPTNVKLGLSTTTPQDDGSGITEPGGNNYARLTYNTWNPAAAGAVTNNGAAQFPLPSGLWGFITHAVVYADATAMFYLEIPAQTVDNGDPVLFSASYLQVTLD